MKHYKTLIKLKQREVDALRKQMSTLTDQKDILEQLVANLEKDLLNEVSTAGGLVEMGVFFGDYSEAIKQKRVMVEEKIKAVDKQIAVLADKIMIVYGEQKKFEIAQQRKLAELAYQEEQREQQFIDEVAAQRHDTNA